MIHINNNLERYLYEKLDATYGINPSQVTSNIDNDEEINKQYLGTYFPRTFLEAYNIYGAIFTNDDVYQKFSELEDINVLIIGSGTGGDLFGMLQILNERFSGKNINIHSIDGNQNALEYQSTIFSVVYQENILEQRNNLKLYKYHLTFTNEESLHDQIARYVSDTKMNIIQTFKFCNELYNNVSKKYIFSEVLEVAERYLQPNGVLVIEDVTSKNNDDKYNSIIMSNQVKDYLKNNQQSELRYIWPVSCAKWHHVCPEQSCFCKVQYNISHRHAQTDISKVVIKLLIKQPLGDEVVSKLGNEVCYQVSDGAFCTDEDYYFNQNQPPKQPVGFTYEI